MSHRGDPHSLYRVLGSGDVTVRAPTRLPEESRDPAVRLYCTSADARWTLQVRGYRTLADGTCGREFMIAGASLDREAMVALRDAVDALLEEYAEYRDPAGPGSPDGGAE